jgi:hypothetical protein
MFFYGPVACHNLSNIFSHKHKTFTFEAKIFKICDTCISLDFANLTEYIHTTYFKQLEGFVCDAYAITYSYYIFYLNGPLKLKILDLVYCSPHILPQTLSLQ